MQLSRRARATQRNTVYKNQKRRKEERKEREEKREREDARKERRKNF